MKLVRSLFCAVAMLALYGTASAFTLTFDELPMQPVDGLSYQGVSFGFTVGGVNSTDAYYNMSAAGPFTVNVQDPSLVGTAAGVLTLDFTAPVRNLRFDVALDIIGPLTPGFTVALFDPNLTPLTTIPINTDSLLPDYWSEGTFCYNGNLLGRATIEFGPNAGVFALDNLSSVPEPSTIFLLGGGMLGLALLARRRGKNIP
jgi:hypothetical protein